MRNTYEAILLAAGLVVASATAHATVTFIGEADFAGNATDLSGLTGNLEDGKPGNRLSLGSGITFNPVTGTYYALPDRGPNAIPYAGGAPVDNTISWQSRYEELTLGVTLGAGPGGSGGTVTANLIATHLLTNETGAAFTGKSDAGALRFDPEAIRVGATGTVYISDEYGPYVYGFDPTTGKRVQTVGVPANFQIANPNPVGANELPPANTSGRQANRGMEGLAASPDGTKLFGIMQNPLIQDNALNAANARRGTNIRIVQFDAATGAAVHEYVYVLGDGTTGNAGGAGLGVNELIAIDDHRFLLVERDGVGGVGAAIKRVVEIDLNGATDVMGVASLPQTGAELAGLGITPVNKKTLIDLLDPSFALAGASFPEKIEGLAFGPDLADGRALLFVTNDNDFLDGTGGSANQPSRILAFAIDDADFDVPEPGTLAVFASAVAALGLVRRRRSSRR